MSDTSSDTNTSTYNTADVSRENSRNTTIINSEISAIETSITNATKAGSYSCIVSGTTMTSSTTGSYYYDVIINDDICLSNYDSLKDQLQQVMVYFQNLGYIIFAIDQANNTFKWKIQW